MGDFTPRYCRYRIVSANEDQQNENSFPSFQRQNHGNVCYPRSLYTYIPNRIYFLLNTVSLYIYIYKFSRPLAIFKETFLILKFTTVL